MCADRPLRAAAAPSEHEDAIVRSEFNEERWLNAELSRIKGELLLLRGASGAEVEGHFLQALKLARRQGALSWELGTATSAARLLVSHGRDTEALDMLAPIYERFTERVVALTSALRQGSSRDELVDVGAIATPLQLEVIEKLVASAVKQGARLLCGGKRVHAERGNFFEPTILDGVTPEMDIAREELFGPVMLLMRVKDDDEAVRFEIERGEIVTKLLRQHRENLRRGVHRGGVLPRVVVQRRPLFDHRVHVRDGDEDFYVSFRQGLGHGELPVAGQQVEQGIPALVPGHAILLPGTRTRAARYCAV